METEEQLADSITGWKRRDNRKSCLRNSLSLLLTHWKVLRSIPTFTSRSFCFCLGRCGRSLPSSPTPFFFFQVKLAAAGYYLDTGWESRLNLSLHCSSKAISFFEWAVAVAVIMPGKAVKSPCISNFGSWLCLIRCRANHKLFNM